MNNKIYKAVLFSLSIASTGCSNSDDIKLPPQLFLPEIVINHATIPPSTTPKQLSIKGIPGIDANFSYTFDGERKTLTQYLSDASVRSFIILKDGNIVYEYYRSPFTNQSRQQSWSVSKQVLSILVGIAIDEGKIGSVEDSMDQYEPRLSTNGFAGVSFRQALQMSSGIKFDEKKDRFNLFFDIIEDRFSLGGFGATLTEKTLDPGLTNDYEPDSIWHYASINTQAISMALAAATQSSIQDYLWEKLWNPLGISHSARILVDREHHEFTFCCLYATARSYATLGQLYANGGHYNGEQIVSSEWVRLSTTLDDTRSWSGSEGAHPEGVTSDNFGFAYHWWPLKGDRGDFTALGVYGQSVHIFPYENVVIVRLSGDHTEGAHREESLSLNRAIADFLK